MPARGSVIGMIAIEHTDVDHFSARDVELIEGFVAPASPGGGQRTLVLAPAHRWCG